MPKSFLARFPLSCLSARRGYSQKSWFGVCGPLNKTLTLFMTKICDSCYPSYDQIKNFETLFMTVAAAPLH